MKKHILPILAIALGSAAQAQEGNSTGDGLLSSGVLGLYYADIKYDPDNVDIDEPHQGAMGASGAFALPLTSNISLQFDIQVEVNVTGSNGDNDLTKHDSTGALHLNYRDPAMYSVGAFVGGGRSMDDGDNDGDPVPFWFGGLEGEYYWNNFTLGGQIGILDSKDNYLESIYDARFARLHAAYYLGTNTRLSAEVSRLHGDRPNEDPDSGGVLDLNSWGLRVDHQIADTPWSLMLAYDAFDYKTTEESDAPWVKEVRVGISYMFGAANLRDNDRRGAGGSLPKINRWISTSANEIE